MNLNTDIAVGHARALATNYRSAHPNASDSLLADYVASEMVEFVKRARSARDVADDYDSWYAHTIVNFGAAYVAR